MPTNDHDLNQARQRTTRMSVTPRSPGYEMTDVNVSGIAVFLAGLFGLVIVFFLLCFVMGKVINVCGIEKSDGPTTKWNKLLGVCRG